MAFIDFIKKQFIDVLQWNEEGDTVLAARLPMQDFEIQYGASLTVRESQLAVFVDEGRIADVFAPGRYRLTTQTLPLLTNLKHWDKLFESPFKSDVYFFSTRARLDRKWGTPAPVTIRDKEFGAVRLRAFGTYAYRLVDAQRFFTKVSGTQAEFTADELEGQLRSTLSAALAEVFAASGVPFLDMAANQDAFARALSARVATAFAELGVALETLLVQNLSLPEELQKALDARIGMNVVGDLGRYTQFQVANSIPLAAQNEGGLAGIGAAAGVGLGLGQAMAQTMQSAAAPASVSADELVATLEKLHGLVGKGILTAAEFEAKKAELLKKLA